MRRLFGVLTMVALQMLPAEAVDQNAAATYTDKNGFFQFIPPHGWVRKEFDDPRTKVSFDVPSPVAGQNKAGIFLLSHPLSHEIDLDGEAQDRVARLKQMGSPDAKLSTVDFAGAKAKQIEGQMGRQNMRIRALMFTAYGRSYTVQYSATKQDYAQFWPLAEEALSTFKCLPPNREALSTNTPAGDAGKIQAEKIRVLVTALKEQDIGVDAENSLIQIGVAARAALEEARRSGTPIQKERAARILERLEE